MRIITALLFTAVITATGVSTVHAQEPTKKTHKEDSDDLENMLEDDNGSASKEYTSATFKATRIVNGHSVENVAKGVLDFRIAHRFGSVDGGLKSFFGLDGAATALCFDYGVTDWAMVGVMRSTYDKEYEGYTKIKILRQQTGKAMPISLSYFGAISVTSNTAPTLPAGQKWLFTNRMSYANQLLVARKFNNWLSLQLMPTLIHYNLVPTTAESNNTFAMGIGGRVKVSNRMSVNAEYYYRIPGTELSGYKNALSVGVDIETGGHVFQLMLTNASTITERAFVGQTVDDFFKGKIHFGFNISRVFTIVKPKGFEDTRNKTW